MLYNIYFLYNVFKHLLVKRTFLNPYQITRITYIDYLFKNDERLNEEERLRMKSYRVLDTLEDRAQKSPTFNKFPTKSTEASFKFERFSSNWQ